MLNIIREKQIKTIMRGIPWLFNGEDQWFIQSWIFTGRTDAEVEAPILWPPDVTSRLIGKDPDAWKDWRQEEKGMTEDKMVGWHHWLNGHEFEQIPKGDEGQGSPACCSPRGCKELYMTERLNNHHQWLRLGTFTALAQVWSLVMELRSHKPQGVPHPSENHNEIPVYTH